MRKKDDFFRNHFLIFIFFSQKRYFENRDKQNRLLRQSNIHTVSENVIATNKMRNNFCYPFGIFRNIGIFSIASHLVITLTTLLQFLYEFCRLVYGFFSVLLPI